MLADHKKVLKWLAENSGEEACFPFQPIMKATRLSRQRVRFICRSLRRKGFAEFYSNLWSHDGEPAGSGYCISKAGREAAAQLNQ
jgi:hypothetical protein